MILSLNKVKDKCTLEEALYLCMDTPYYLMRRTDYDSYVFLEVSNGNERSRFRYRVVLITSELDIIESPINYKEDISLDDAIAKDWEIYDIITC